MIPKISFGAINVIKSTMTEYNAIAQQIDSSSPHALVDFIYHDDENDTANNIYPVSIPALTDNDALTVAQQMGASVDETTPKATFDTVVKDTLAKLLYEPSGRRTKEASLTQRMLDYAVQHSSGPLKDALEACVRSFQAPPQAADTE